MSTIVIHELFSGAGPITAMNAIMADSLVYMTDEMEALIRKGMDKKEALFTEIKTTLAASIGNFQISSSVLRFRYCVHRRLL